MPVNALQGNRTTATQIRHAFCHYLQRSDQFKPGHMRSEAGVNAAAEGRHRCRAVPQDVRPIRIQVDPRTRASRRMVCVDDCAGLNRHTGQRGNLSCPHGSMKKAGE